MLALAWVVLPLALLWVARWAYAPARGQKAKPGPLLIALSAMAEERTHSDCDHGASEGSLNGGYIPDPKQGVRDPRVAEQRLADIHSEAG